MKVVAEREKDVVISEEKMEETVSEEKTEEVEIKRDGGEDDAD